MAEVDHLLVGFPKRKAAAGASAYGAAGGSKADSPTAPSLPGLPEPRPALQFQTSRQREQYSVEKAMLECTRVARRLLGTLETRREDVRSSVGTPRRGSFQHSASRSGDGRKDRVLATLRGHLRYYCAQSEAVQEDVEAQGNGVSWCATTFPFLPCETPTNRWSVKGR
jgi:hypothetical protein